MSAAQVEDRSVSFGEFVLDERRAALYRNGIAVALRPKCFEVLRLLVVNAGRVVTKDELLDAVWGDVVVTAHVDPNRPASWLHLRAAGR